MQSIFKDLLKPLYGEKNSKKSAEKREAGNAQFYAGNYRQALMLYSVAVYSGKISTSKDNDFQIEKNSNENRDYSLALANRSACLQRMKRYKIALQDISLALGERIFMMLEILRRFFNYHSVFCKYFMRSFIYYLDAGYRIEKSFKLYERKAECYEAIFAESLKEHKSDVDDGYTAIDAYKEAIKMVSKSNLSKEKMETIQRKLTEATNGAT